MKEIVKEVIKHWGGGQWQDVSNSSAPHEAEKLHLSIEKTYHFLKWYPRLSFTETVKKTVEWYRQYYTACDNTSASKDTAVTQKLCQQQILNYEKNIKSSHEK